MDISEQQGQQKTQTDGEVFYAPPTFFWRTALDDEQHVRERKTCLGGPHLSTALHFVWVNPFGQFFPGFMFGHNISRTGNKSDNC